MMELPTEIFVTLNVIKELSNTSENVKRFRKMISLDSVMYAPDSLRDQFVELMDSIMTTNVNVLVKEIARNILKEDVL